MENDTSHFRLSVSDSGTGLTKEEKQNCIKTFTGMDYFNSFNYDPCNIGYGLFSSHLLAIMLAPDEIKEKGLNLISEQGVGCCFSFCIADFEDKENLRDNEEDLEHLQSKLEKFNGVHQNQSKFLEIEKQAKPMGRGSINKLGYRQSGFSPKRHSNISSTVIHTVDPKKNLFTDMVKLNNVEENENMMSKSQKLTFNEFYRNSEDKTFTIAKSNASENEDFKAMNNNGKIPNSKNQFLELAPVDNDFSSIACSKLGTELVWSFSSDSQILKIVSDFNIFEDQLKQIKEINKLKKCTCHDILICDYDEMSNYSIKNVFSLLGFSTESISLSYLAEEQVRKKLESNCCKNYKFILIFINMPTISGYEVCKKIRNIYDEKKIPKPILIAIASKISENEQKLIKEAGFLDFVSKPIMQNTINFYVKKYLVIDLVHRKISFNVKY